METRRSTGYGGFSFSAWASYLSRRRMSEKPENHSVIPAKRIEHAIYSIQGHRVMLDADLAKLYGVPTKSLNLAVRRNADRFPGDFMFQLTPEEWDRLRFQFETSKGRGGRRYLPNAFTEQGVAMLSSVLKSKRAVAVNIQIMRAFVRLRQMLSTNADLSRRLEELEKKYDRQFRTVFDAIRELMTAPAEPPKPPIGFNTEKK
jgi:hypothetical protein